MGRRNGKLISALSHMDAINARGPAFNQWSCRCGKISPSILRGPRVGRALSWAMHSHTNSGWCVLSFSNGKPPLHNVCISSFRAFLPLGRQEIKERRSPVMGSSSLFMSGWMWWFIRERACCKRSWYVSNLLPKLLARPKKRWQSWECLICRISWLRIFYITAMPFMQCQIGVRRTPDITDEKL